MLQQGLNVPDVAYYREDTPKMTGIRPSSPDWVSVRLYECRVCEGHGRERQDDHLAARYTIQGVGSSKQETMRPEVLEKIKELVNKGANVLGPAPTRSPSLQNQPEADQQIQQMAAELWAGIDGVDTKHAQFGKGTIMSGLTMEEAFQVINSIPDCKLPEDNSIHYGHRAMED